jgi:ABC transporter substrate binding protein
LSYGANRLDQYRRSAAFVDKILRGAKPADLPVGQPTKFERVINLKTAKTLGLTIPQSVLLRADELIQEIAHTSVSGPTVRRLARIYSSVHLLPEPTSRRLRSPILLDAGPIHP